MKTSAIDNGFLQINKTDARKLSPILSACGKEKLVKHNNKHYWLTLTRNFGKWVWSIRETDWKLVNGRAVL